MYNRTIVRHTVIFETITLILKGGNILWQNFYIRWGHSSQNINGPRSSHG